MKNAPIKKFQLSDRLGGLLSKFVMHISFICILLLK